MNTDRFKFRIWDNELKEYVEYSAHDSVRMCLHPDGDVGYLYHDEEIRKAFNDGCLVVEQCTGLKDASGELIYEGDIICGKNREVCHEVVFDSERACFRAELLPKPKHWMQNSLYCTPSQQWIDEFNKRVVGNIHENPELLEGKE